MELSQQSYSSEEEKWKNTYFSLAFVDISPDDEGGTVNRLKWNVCLYGDDE